MKATLQKIGLIQEDPQELAKKWQRQLREEVRQLDRQIRDISREEAKCKLEIKKLAKVGGQEGAMKSLAKEIVHSQKAVERIQIAKMHVASCSMQIRNQAAQLRMNKVFESSTEAMKAMSAAMNAPETAGRLRELGLEMQKAGLIQEMAEEAMDEAFEDLTTEAEVDEAVDKVVAELTMKTLDKAGTAPITAIRKHKSEDLVEAAFGKNEEAEEENEEDRELEKRLAALQS
jgi:charged multivesicular body protein 3